MAYKVSPFREARERLHEITPGTAHEEARDLFHAFVKSDPKLVPEESVQQTFRRNWQVNSKALENLKYKELHGLTRNAPVQAALAVRDILPELEPLYKRSEKLQKELEEQQEREEQLQQALKDLVDADAQGDQDLSDSLQQQIDALQGAIDDAQPQLDSRLEAFGSAAQAAVGRGMQKATDNAEQTQALARGFDLTPAELAQKPPEEQLALAKLLQNDRLKQAAEFLGALQNLASNVIRWRQGIPEQIKGIRIGDDLEFLLTEELAQLDDEDMQWDFMARFAELALLLYDVEGRDQKGNGGVGVGCDISTSMSGIPISWAIALTLALFTIAHKDERPFVAVFFNTHVQKRIELKQETFIQNLAEMASINASGGTCFTEPLDMLLAGLEEHAVNGTTQSDLVFITDDQCAVPDYWLEQYHRRLDAIGGRTWGVAVGGRSRSGPLWDICQGAVWNVTDFAPNSTRPIKEIFDGIAAYRKEKAAQ